MNYNRAKMKQEVKRIMRETRPRPIWVSLLYLVIVAVGGWVIQGLLGAVMGVSSIEEIYTQSYLEALMYGGDIEWAVQQMVTYLLQHASVLSGIITGSILIGILSSLWQSLMSVSYVGYALDMVRGKNPGVKRLFSAFPKFGSVILTRILVGVFSFLWMIPFVVAFAVIAFVAGLLFALEGVGVVFGVLLLIADYVGLTVGSAWVTLRYAMVDYLVMDQDLSGREAIRASKQMMKGCKGRLFMLQLSFIGWTLLVAAIIYVGIFVVALCVIPMAGGSMGGILVGVILMFVVLIAMVVGVVLLEMWLTPYISGSYAKFYEFTMSQRPDLFVKVTDEDQSFGNPSYPSLD